jgi:hypothetical protein
MTIDFLLLIPDEYLYMPVLGRSNVLKRSFSTRFFFKTHAVPNRAAGPGMGMVCLHFYVAIVRAPTDTPTGDSRCFIPLLAPRRPAGTATSSTFYNFIITDGIRTGHFGPDLPLARGCLKVEKCPRFCGSLVSVLADFSNSSNLHNVDLVHI